LEYKGQTTLKAQDIPNDGKNVVSYGYLQWDSNRKIYAAVITKRYPAPNENRIKEQDMRFNYHANYYDHSSKGPGRVCIKEVATHEWGHFVKLKDITTTQLTNPPCPRYAKYTMYTGTPPINTHDRESVECEDQWGVFKKYGHIPGTQN